MSLLVLMTTLQKFILSQQKIITNFDSYHIYVNSTEAGYAIVKINRLISLDMSIDTM